MLILSALTAPKESAGLQETERRLVHVWSRRQQSQKKKEETL